MLSRHARNNCFAICAVAAAIQPLSGCNSSSNSQNDTIFAQAIDGYIVGASVFCDDEATGGTTAAGNFTCPKNTQLMRISGGTDVGFDSEKTQGENAFLGELTAPGSLDYATPLSTLAVALSTLGNDDSELSFDDAENQLASTLGLSSLDLNADASKTMQVIKLNAQLHNITSSFSSTTDEYKITTTALANVFQKSFEGGTQSNLSADIEGVMTAVNSALASLAPDMALSSTNLAELIKLVSSANTAIESAANPNDIVELGAAYEHLRNIAFEINRSDSIIAVEGYYSNREYYSLKEFEDSQINFGSYRSIIDSYYADMYINEEAFRITKTLDKTQIGLGFKFVATSDKDSRRLSITTNHALISMEKDYTESLQVEFPSSALFHASVTDRYGVITNVTLNVNDGKIFNLRKGAWGINIEALNNAIENRGYASPFYSTGNFEVTFVMSGIGIGVVSDDESFAPETYSVTTNDTTVTGNGFRGYITVNHDGWW